MEGPRTITRILNAFRARQGGEPSIPPLSGLDAASAKRANSLIQAELRRLASGQLRKERGPSPLEPTVLVNEAYIRLMDRRDRPWANRAHFYGAAAIAMRRILVEEARRRMTRKRGGDVKRVPLTDLPDTPRTDADDLLALDAALTALATHDPRLHQIVMLRFFAGLSVEQIAEALGVSGRTVIRDWTYARAWLHERMHPGEAVAASGPRDK